MSEADLAEDELELPEPSAPADFLITLKGFADAEKGKLLADKVGGFVFELSQYIDLGRLDGVTLAFDYQTALWEVDRGFSTSRPLQATNDSRFSLEMPESRPAENPPSPPTRPRDALSAFGKSTAVRR